MSLLQAYLQKPSTQRVLQRKPGEKGFSLIELVVVVAVLAILAAIAVPAFMGMSESAADAAMETNLKNAYKECAYQVARGQYNRGLAYASFDYPQDDGYYTYDSDSANANDANHGCLAADGTGTILTATKAGASADGKINGDYTINVTTGTRAQPAAPAAGGE